MCIRDVEQTTTRHYRKKVIWRHLRLVQGFLLSSLCILVICLFYLYYDLVDMDKFIVLNIGVILVITLTDEMKCTCRY